MLFKDKIVNRRKNKSLYSVKFWIFVIKCGGFFEVFEVIAQENKISKTYLLLYKYFWIVDIMACLYLNFSNLILSNINYFTNEFLKDKKKGEPLWHSPASLWIRRCCRGMCCPSRFSLAWRTQSFLHIALHCFHISDKHHDLLYWVLHNFLILCLPELNKVSVGEQSLASDIPGDTQKGKGPSSKTSTAKSRLETAPENGSRGIHCQGPCWETGALFLSSFRQRSGRCYGWKAKTSGSVLANVGPFCWCSVVTFCLCMRYPIHLDVINFLFFVKLFA